MKITIEIERGTEEQSLALAQIVERCLKEQIGTILILDKTTQIMTKKYRQISVINFEEAKP